MLRCWLEQEDTGQLAHDLAHFCSPAAVLSLQLCSKHCSVGPRCLQVFVLSVPQPGRPLHCATFPAEDNPFVKDLVARLTVGQPHDKRSRLSRC